MAEFPEGAFRIENGTEYSMEFTPQSRWDCEISAKYRDGARGVLRLNIRFDSTETSLDISVRNSKGAAVMSDRLCADNCGHVDIPDGIRFCELNNIRVSKGKYPMLCRRGYIILSSVTVCWQERRVAGK